MSEDVEWVKTITLSEPVKCGSEVFTEIKFRKPTLGDMREMPASEKYMKVGDYIDIALLCSNIPNIQTFDKVGAADLNNVIEAVSSFLGDGQDDEPDND